VLPPGRPIALVKIDAEGAERQLLEGAAKTIERDHPVLYFEHHRAARAFGTSARELFGLLVGSFGYRIFDVQGTGRTTRRHSSSPNDIT
jgi:hypothetical protein